VPERVNDANWSLTMALAWASYRTAQAVMNIRYGRWAPTKTAVCDLLAALRSGKLRAHGRFEDERISHPIDTAVWSTFEIVLGRKMFLGHMFPPTPGTPVAIAQRIGSPQTRLLDVTVPTAGVRKLWPAAKRTVAAETRCQGYLAAEMRRTRNRSPKPKGDFLADCRARFPGLSERGFERAWASAIKQTGAVNWGKGGRPRKSSH
jgi:hypothetical protein